MIKGHFYKRKKIKIKNSKVSIFTVFQNPKKFRSSAPFVQAIADFVREHDVKNKKYLKIAI